MTLQSKGRKARPEVAALAPWFHNLHLPGGVQTAPDHPLGDFPAFKWAELAPALPDDLSRWSALDIGCNAGFYTFELARRGAAVVGIDLDDHYLRQARWAAERLGLADAVELRRMGVYDLARSGERWDLVLFMGVLYHLRHPLLALDLVAAAARRLVVLQTLTTDEHPQPYEPVRVPNLDYDERERLHDRNWPHAAFVEQKLFGDPTNWWVPTAPCVEAMARSAGLEIVARPGHELYVCRPAGLPRRVARELEAAVGAGYRRVRTSTKPKGRTAASAA